MKKAEALNLLARRFAIVHKRWGGRYMQQVGGVMLLRRPRERMALVLSVQEGMKDWLVEQEGYEICDDDLHSKNLFSYYTAMQMCKEGKKIRRAGTEGHHVAYYGDCFNMVFQNGETSTAISPNYFNVYFWYEEVDDKIDRSQSLDEKGKE